MNNPIRSNYDVEVKIKHKINPDRSITMSMAEYRDFIRIQSEILGITQEPKIKEEKKINGFQGTIIGAEIPKGLEKIFKAMKEDLIKIQEGVCPRCGNSEIQKDDEFCKICGLKIPARKEK